MRFTKLALVLLALFLAAGLHPALAGKQDFQLFNRTGVDIYALYIAPSGTEDWGENVLDVDVLLDGGDIGIEFDRSETAELWDVRIEDSEGEALEWDEINLLEASELILEADGSARIK